MIAHIDIGILCEINAGEGEDKPKLAQVPLPLVNVSRDDYESLPSYMKSLAPWEVWNFYLMFLVVEFISASFAYFSAI